MFCEMSLVPDEFGEYHSDGFGLEYDTLEELIGDMRNACYLHGYKLYQLGIDTLPDNISDIRGSILNETSIVFAVAYPDEDFGPTYHGILEY